MPGFSGGSTLPAGLTVVAGNVGAGVPIPLARLETDGILRVTGAAVVPASGSGAEMFLNGALATFMGFNRSGSAALASHVGGNGSTTGIRQDTALNVGLNTTTWGTNAARVLALGGPATTPTTSPADVVQVWPGDWNGAGTHALFLRTEDGVVHVLGGNVGLGTTTPGGRVETDGVLRVTGVAVVPASGSGAEMYVSANIATFIGYNRAGSVALASHYGGDGSTTGLRIGTTGLVSLGQLTSSYPALKRSSALLQARLADDSAFTEVGASAVGDATVPFRARSSLATPGTLVNGDWWVDASGTSPARVVALKCQDGGATRTIASVTY